MMTIIKEYFIKSVDIGGRPYKLMRAGRTMASPCRLYVDGELFATGTQRYLDALIKGALRNHSAAVLEEVQS